MRNQAKPINEKSLMRNQAKPKKVRFMRINAKTKLFHINCTHCEKIATSWETLGTLIIDTKMTSTKTLKTSNKSQKYLLTTKVT